MVPEMGRRSCPSDLGREHRPPLRLVGSARALGLRPWRRCRRWRLAAAPAGRRAVRQGGSARRGRSAAGDVVASRPIADWAATRIVWSAVSSASRSRASTRGASAVRTSRTRSRAVSGPTARPSSARRSQTISTVWRLGSWPASDGLLGFIAIPPTEARVRARCTSTRRSDRGATARRAAGSRSAAAAPACRRCGRIPCGRRGRSPAARRRGPGGT